MGQFTNFTAAGHKIISSEMQTELAALGEKYGLKFSVGGGKLGDNSFEIKVSVRPADRKAAEAQAAETLGWAGIPLGIVSEDYGTVFVHAGKAFRLTGVNMNRPAYPVSGNCVKTGRSYKFPASVAHKIVAARLKKAA